ncbi:MAG TPA: LysM peptidoglycan-binding domain-containing protein [Gammaproteobacteria bacterium]|nr:LysM peptidoglycan-binding domain-containing protein [Gammaproteobacteria bacterium]
MKLVRPLQYLSVTAFALAVAVGCATAPKPKEAAPAPQAQQGPSAATTQALADAKAAMAKMKAVHWVWRDTGKIMKQAEKAAAEGNDAKAQKLAREVQQQSEDAVNQYYLEKAKWMMESVSRAQGLNSSQMQARNEAQQAIDNAQGKKAYDLVSQLAAELKAANIQYTVARGDSLWSIAGQSDIYNNPYEWPLIYKNNASKIRDADLIYPGQVFDIERNPSSADVDAAIHHAKTRGSWSLGRVEQSDQSYLGSLRVR